MNNTTQQRIGATIRSFRKANNMTLEQLAEYTDTAISYIGSIERGERNITINTLEKIAHVFDLDVFDFFAVGSANNEFI
ncbi:helix-turn-helix transcriptional regulator [Salicibibacter cibarius]|uniref:Helix-turn-helix transcriptional regulator n=1 Tax=Salicibibacter cibarius TaxID=2743000 RepID=A0A7T7CD47_9BACI|nr:helix-turn-helix transcriptional regulator [Salicibibacter cibarius]QQK77613.1 helix-turn-helix transcriptional regulator [Salicibibacter cibarius]